jgi:hypothetical protein
MLNQVTEPGDGDYFIAHASYKRRYGNNFCWFSFCIYSFKIVYMTLCVPFKKARVFDCAVAILLLISLLLTTSCARKIHFDNSNVVPAARGTVKVKTDDNNNHSIQVNVRHLAPPARLQPPKSVYVVWIETTQNGVQNLGQLKTSTGLISKTLKASLDAVTPFTPRRVFVTAENQANIEFPSSFVVLNATSF